MRLVIKEYLSQLKEKDELDFLLGELLVQQGYIADNKPKTGNRQFGVDIQVHNKDEILLLVIKQGDISRKIWDGDSNAVRPSLNEIKDVYLPTMTETERKKSKKIIVATNGYLDEAVRMNWKMYVNGNSTEKGGRISYEFWSIDHIVDLIETNMFSEHLFDAEMQSLLRKALYYIEEQDYKNQYFEIIVDKYIERLGLCTSKKLFQKTISSLHLACRMISRYASEKHIYKIGIMVYEYLIIKYWQFLLKNSYLGKGFYVEYLLNFLHDYEQCNEVYFKNIRKISGLKRAFPTCHPIEKRVMLFEVLGYLSSYGHYMFDVDKEHSKEILNCIIELTNNNSECLYAPYDCHIGIIFFLYMLLLKHERVEDVLCIQEVQCKYMAEYYRYSHMYPVPSDTFEDAINLYMGNPIEEYSTSGFWGGMMLCMACMNQKRLYNELRNFLDKDLKDVTKCIWFIRKDEENLFYDRLAMNLSGEGLSIDVESDYETFRDKMKFIIDQYRSETLSFIEYSFDVLEFIVCRYYGYVPQIWRYEFA